jgi:hypothetical protein
MVRFIDLVTTKDCGASPVEIREFIAKAPEQIEEAEVVAEAELDAALPERGNIISIMYLNKVFLYGNLTRDPELKASPGWLTSCKLWYSDQSLFQGRRRPASRDDRVP